MQLRSHWSLQIWISILLLDNLFSQPCFGLLFGLKTRKSLMSWLWYCVLLWNGGSPNPYHTVKLGNADQIWAKIALYRADVSPQMFLQRFNSVFPIRSQQRHKEGLSVTTTLTHTQTHTHRERNFILCSAVPWQRLLLLYYCLKHHLTF